jgi:hypothetical protein
MERTVYTNERYCEGSLSLIPRVPSPLPPPHSPPLPPPFPQVAASINYHMKRKKKFHDSSQHYLDNKKSINLKIPPWKKSPLSLKIRMNLYHMFGNIRTSYLFKETYEDKT